VTPDLRERLQAALGDAFRIQKELGGGGMSRLFLAEEASLHRQVVVKVLPPEFASEVSAARFQREIKTAARLSHPNILPVLTAGAHDDLLYYVMPYVPGESLRHRLVREGRLPVADALQILREVADALAFAHAAGVLHRDIKPENILLQSGHATLTDFGVARAIAESRSGERLTGTGMIVGTPGYMSPEQVAGERSLDARVDVYALAVVAYEMLAGAPPFQGPTAQAVLAAHLTGTPRVLAELRPETPAAVSAVIARALAKDPSERLRTAAELRDALATTTAAAGWRLSRPAWIAATAGAVLLVAIGGYFGMRSTAPGNLDADLVAVAPFDVVGDAALQPWREGLVDLVARNLDGAGPLRTVSPTLSIKRWSGRADPASASALGERLGAGLAVFGQLVSARGDSVRLTASVVDVGTGRRVGDVDLRGAGDDVERLADSISVSLLAELGRTRPVGAVRQTSLGTRSLPAIRAFLRGEQFYRRAQWDSARVAYQTAIREDSAFGLAYHRHAQVLGWTGGPYHDAMLRAGERNVGLAPRESLALAADSLWAAYEIGEMAPGPNLERLIATSRELVRRYPDPQSWYWLGEVLLHHAEGPFAVSPDEVLGAFDHALALDSAFGPAYEHAIGLTIALRTRAEAVRRARAALALAPDQRDALQMFVRLVDPSAEVIPAEDLKRQLDSLSIDQLALLGFHVMDWADTGTTVLTVLEALAEAIQTGQSAGHPRSSGMMVTAGRGLLKRGRLSLAFRSLSTPPPIARAVIALAVAGGASAASVATPFRSWIQQGRREGAYTLWWWAEHGELEPIDAFRRLAHERERTASHAGARTQWRRAGAATRPYRLLVLGDTAAALAAFAALADSFAPQALDQLARARLLEARHADAEAAELLERFPLTPLSGGPVYPYWSLLRARVKERLGDREQAIRDYSYVATMWRYADAELQPYYEEARAGLARLSGETP